MPTTQRAGLRRSSVTLAAILLITTALMIDPRIVGAAGLCPVYNDGTYSFTTLVDRKGVAICQQQKVGTGIIAYWTIVDFKAGARARIVSQTATGTTVGQPSTKFVKRRAPDWFTYTAANVPSPNSGALFSITNASIFVSDLGSTTSLNYPLRQDYQVKSTGEVPGINPKRWLGFGSNTTAYGYLGNYEYNGQSYTGNDPAIINGLYTNIRDYVVSLGSTTGIESTTKTKRVYVGFVDTDGNNNGDRMIILQTNVGYTVAEADGALGWWGCPPSWRIQLDGGGSVQFYANNGQQYLTSLRIVPSVIAVWQTP